MSVLNEKMAEGKQPRPVYVYDVPPGVSDSITSLGLVELTVQEELMASKRAAGDTHRLAYELTLQSLAEINGERVRLADGTADKAFNEMGPKLRQLMMQAYAKLHGPGDQEAVDFLRSQKVKVG